MCGVPGTLERDAAAGKAGAAMGGTRDAVPQRWWPTPWRAVALDVIEGVRLPRTGDRDIPCGGVVESTGVALTV